MIAALLAGTIATYVIVVAGALAYMEAAGVHDRDGGLAMAVVFGIGPLAGLIVGIVCAIAVPIWLDRRDWRRDMATPSATPSRPPRGPRVLIAAIATGLTVYLLGRLVLWLSEGVSYESYWTAFAVSVAPLVVALAAAALAAFLAVRGPGTAT